MMGRDDSHDAGRSPCRRRSEWNELNVSAMMRVILHPSRCAGRSPLFAVLARLELVNAMSNKHSTDVSQAGILSCSRSEEHTSELQSHVNLVCRLLLEKKNTWRV